MNPNTSRPGYETEIVGAGRADETDHQEFRLQNDREWREKLEFQKTRATAAESELAAVKAKNSRLREEVRLTYLWLLHHHGPTLVHEVTRYVLENRGAALEPNNG